MTIGSSENARVQTMFFPSCSQLAWKKSGGGGLSVVGSTGVRASAGDVANEIDATAASVTRRARWTMDVVCVLMRLTVSHMPNP